MIKRIVHTTGNSHPGGDKGGLFNFANTFIPFLVKNPETAPVARGTAMQVISFLVSFFKNIPFLVWEDFRTTQVFSVYYISGYRFLYDHI